MYIWLQKYINNASNGFILILIVVDLVRKAIKQTKNKYFLWRGPCMLIEKTWYDIVRFVF